MQSDVVVIGSGAVGAAVAYYLTRAGATVTVLEKEDVAAGSSGACDGFLFLQSKKPGVPLAMALASLPLFDALEQEIECDLELERPGGFIVAETEQELQVLAEMASALRRAGLRVQVTSPDELRDEEPCLSPRLLGATYCPDDGHINPLALTIGLSEAARRRGADIRLHTPVERIVVDHGRVRGVKTNDGVLEARTVVVAAGVWSPALLAPLGLRLPVLPRRGHVLVTEPLPRLVRHVLLDASYMASKLSVPGETDAGSPAAVGFSAEQKGSGNLLIGSSREFCGFDRRTSHEVVGSICRRAVSFIPSLGQVSCIRTFAGLRPYTPDGLPLLGPVEGFEGLHLATGHEGDGIALAPITGELVAESIMGDVIPDLVKPCLLSRFPS